MRPLSGNDAAAPRSRKSSIASSTAHAGPASNVPTTFFLRSEEELEDSLSKSKNKTQDSTYGVKSIDDTSAEALSQSWDQDVSASKSNAGDGKRKQDSKASPKKHKSAILQQISTIDQAKNTLQRAPASHGTSRRSSRNTISHPHTPTIPNTPRSASLRSFRMSDEEMSMDEVASQAITSGGEEEEDDAERAKTSSEMPELVMPSIQMPTRRPFTERGKNLGRLKILVAGEMGSGKTSFIRSLVQLCEDIVHVDPLASGPPKFQVPTKKSTPENNKKGGETRTEDVKELSASTRAYPAWWSDLEESRVLQKWKNQGDAVLERNLCIIDTPGYRPASVNEDINRVVEYMEALLYQNTSLATMTDNELLGVLSGNGGVHVDVVIYLFTQKTDLSKDIEFFQRLSDLSNVIPVISKGDFIDAAQLHSFKESILTKINQSSAKPFLFGKTVNDQLEALDARRSIAQPGTASQDDMKNTVTTDCIHPFAVPSSPVLDSEVMDASLLMSSDYIHPLLPSEFPPLISMLFDPDNVAWLRHTAARKFIQWRRRTTLPGDSVLLHKAIYGQNNASKVQPSLHGQLTTSVRGTTSVASSMISSPSQVLVPQSASPYYSQPVSPNPSATGLESRPSEFTLARLKDHTQREERLAQIRLAKWASDLQRSLNNERERFEKLERDKRAQWLLERVGEEVRNGAIVAALPGSQSPSRWAMTRHGTPSKMNDPSRWGYQGEKLNSRDPLGVCEWGDGARTKGVIVVQVLGGVGVLGAVVVAAMRAWGGEGSGVWGWVAGGD